jgi:hypothetical protein
MTSVEHIPVSRHPVGTRRVLQFVLALFMNAFSSFAYPQAVLPNAPLSNRSKLNTNVQEQANSVLAIMSYTTVPDVTTSSLAINNGATGNPGFAQTQLGGGFTISNAFPLYLEGTIALSRYDPTFVATDGTEQRLLPVKWDTASTTVGVGWDFPITDELRLRPILNGTIGRVTSDLRIAQAYINHVADTNLSF